MHAPQWASRVTWSAAARARERLLEGQLPPAARGPRRGRRPSPRARASAGPRRGSRGTRPAPIRTSAEKSKPSKPTSGTEARRGRGAPPRSYSARRCGSARTSKASDTTRKRSAAAGSPGLRSGWICRARFWYARRISASVALRRDPQDGVEVHAVTRLLLVHDLGVDHVAVLLAPVRAARRQAPPGAARPPAAFWYSTSARRCETRVSSWSAASILSAPPSSTALRASSSAFSAAAASASGSLSLFSRSVFSVA